MSHEEYNNRLMRAIEILDEIAKAKPVPAKREPKMFRPMSPDEYIFKGRICAERESFEEQRDRTLRNNR